MYTNKKLTEKRNDVVPQQNKNFLDNLCCIVSKTVLLLSQEGKLTVTGQNL